MFVKQIERHGSGKRFRQRCNLHQRIGLHWFGYGGGGGGGEEEEDERRRMMNEEEIATE